MPPEVPAPLDAAVAADFVVALVEERPVMGVHDGRGRPAGDRLAVYRNNVVVSLRDALRASFPATERLMGERFFAAAAVAFARETKPASPVLAGYGAGFADFLAGLPGLADYPFVPEVAAIEFARLTAYHAAEGPVLGAAALAAVPAEGLAGLTFVPHPAAAVLSLAHGGFGAYCANAGEDAGGDAAAAGVLVSRPHATVHLAPLSAAERDLAAALLGGVALGAAAAEGFDLGTALGRLVAAGAFSGLGGPSGGRG